MMTAMTADDSSNSLPADMESLLARIRACRLCEAELPHEPRPVIRGSGGSRILIVGQAPGTRVHESGLPFDDASGDRLRSWMEADCDRFYDTGLITFAPMGFCFPGQDARGADLPPLKRCAVAWQEPVRAALPHLEITLLVGLYAQACHLGARRKSSLTETVRHWRQYAPDYFPLPHPSWRNTAWIKRNPWFDGEVLPALKARLREIYAAYDGGVS
jgi:uracil-DNA glycosylase